MSYFSLEFVLLFMPVTALAYAIVPRRVRWLVLLGASYAFLWLVSGMLAAFTVASTLSVYLCGLGMRSCIRKRDAELAQAKQNRRRIKADCKRRMRVILAIGVVFNLMILVALKYLGFFSALLWSMLSSAGLRVAFVIPSIGAPIGISFYTLMMVSYLVDVYRESVAADRHFGRVALYASFFPQIMEGPICRYGQTAAALTEGEQIKRENLYEGTLRILFGIAKKVIVADRLSILVKTVFDNYQNYDGGIIALAAILYTLQLYCDFSGAMDVALGIGHVFNVRLPENFRQPFFSHTASEFWTRWHITLGTWFKDYVYYPVSLSKPCKRLTSAARRRFGIYYGPLLASSVALFCVWMGNGLWHGAGSQYLFFGLYYFVIIMLGNLFDPVAQRFVARARIDRRHVLFRAFQIARTLVVVFVGELFFRANGLKAGLEMFNIMVTRFSLESIARGDVFSMGLDLHDLIVVAVMVALLFAVGVAKEHGWDICAKLFAHNATIRWATSAALLFAVFVFGAYGAGYVPVAPMYAQF